MDLKNVKAVLFDHDGTLVDSELVHYQIWLETTGLSPELFTEEMNTLHCVGIPADVNAAYIIEQFGLDWEPQQLIAQKRENTQQYLKNHCFPAMPGANRIMKNFASLGIRMAIVSGSERFAIERSVSGNNFTQYIEYITTGEEVPSNKPAPDVYLKALQKMNLSASDCIAIEDTEHGVNAAVAAGIPCVAIPNPHSRAQNFTEADVQCQSLSAFYTYFIENR
ncbi:HAD family hydrolase [Planctobacterium marinum]|uniref:HAD family hydrolase n=1 Tax=Planctobacterium marinum TaxID=1631968 RepID=UPI001E3DE6FD|nr:HAD family phosphatase [Planctobacterium marinum]MCC2603906.1 HAD family phosphatase [Planctobacterium marinum]